jgi:hypothetical protein
MRWVVAAALLLLAAAGAVGALVWLNGYTPLTSEGTGAFGPGRANLLTSTTDGEGRPVYVVKNRPAGTFRLHFDLHNDGRFPVEVEGLAGSDSPSEFESVGLENVGRIDPESTRRVSLVTRIGTCKRMVAGGFMRMVAMQVRYTYLRVFHRKQWVELPAGIERRC